MNSIQQALFLLAAGALVSFMGAWFWFSRNAKMATGNIQREDTDKLKARIAELEKQQAVLNQTVIPIATAFQSILIKELTHLHTPELDGLMEKMGPPWTLTEEEEARMIALLERRTRDMSDVIPDSEREAAEILPLLMKRVHRESVAAHVEVQLVGIPPAPLNNKPAAGPVAEKQDEETP